MNSRWMQVAWAAAKGLGHILKSYLTAPDGESYAPGRIMSFGTFAICQCLVIKATADVIAHKPSTADWAMFFQAVAMLEGAIATICVALVMGIAPSDSGGKWWGKDASPPPPPTETPPTKDDAGH